MRISSLLPALLITFWYVTPALAIPPDDERMQQLFRQFHCVICAGQSLAESDAELAIAMRTRIRELATEGKSDIEIRDFMRARYGDGILMQPPVKPATLPLWAAPAIGLLLGMLVVLRYLRKRRN